MKRKISEWLSIQRAKKPGRLVLVGILLFNILFFLLASLIISSLSLSGTEKMGFLEAAFCTITMILDAGCVQFVIADIGSSGVAIAIICLLIIVIGMISFTGAVIGYVTNSISGFIESSNSGTNELKISKHMVILNWNTRASEIVNDLLYCKGKQRVVVLVDGRKDEIAKEINERLLDTISRENKEIRDSMTDAGFFARHIYYFRNRLRRNVDVIIREGDVYSSKQLRDISLERARSVVILGNDLNGSVCKYETKDLYEDAEKGNAQTIKTLMQVSDITSADYSDDNQKIIVEISDDWTWELVEQIIEKKQVDGKCNIVPIRMNRILGQILAQFTLMPELNLAYRELFSNKGASFFVEESSAQSENEYIDEYLKKHSMAIPLTKMRNKGQTHFYYAAENQKDIDREESVPDTDYAVDLNHNYWIENKYVIILGHNSRSKDIMQGFNNFRTEWNYKDGGKEILKIIVIDEAKSLEKMDYYKDYPFVVETVTASICDKDLICSTIERFVSENDEDTSILILSDDSASSDNTDANALAHLVYVQGIIDKKISQDPGFDPYSIDVIVEIIDPKHHDIVSSYSVNNVVISNRYISKMITQIGEKDAIFNFFTDILSYDEAEDCYQSKEVYAKKVSSFFNKLPDRCTEGELVRAVWKASTDASIPKEKQNPTLVLGYVKPGGIMTLFGRNQKSHYVTLEEKDRIIVFTNH